MARKRKALRNRIEPSPSPRFARWALLLKIGSLLFIASTVVGYTLGKALSPKYEDSNTVAAYILNHLDDSSRAASWSIEYLTGTDLVTSLRPLSGTLTFSCHCKSVAYDIAGRKMLAPWANDSTNCKTELEEVQRRGLEFKDSLSVLLGSLEGYSVKIAMTESRNYWLGLAERSLWRRIRIILTSTVAVVSGIGLGFHWGYDEKPKCSEEAFDKELSSPGLWAIVGTEWISQHSWQFKYDRPTVNTTELNAFRPWRTDKKPRPITITGITNGRRFFVFDDFWKDVKSSGEWRPWHHLLEMGELRSVPLRRQMEHNESIRSPSILRILLGA